MTFEPQISRRSFCKSAAALAAVGLAANSRLVTWGAEKDGPVAAKPRFGLVTYMWGADWDLPTLLTNCEKAGALGVELRTGHAHGVEPGISASKAREVKQRFANSPVTLIGLGTNEAFHQVDPASVKASIERAKEFIKLSHEVGGSGVKVKPNDLPPNVPTEKTVEQIGKSLNELGAFGADYGQQIRLEVHGQCSPLPIIASIMKIATHPNVAVCWNCNPQDFQGEGLERNFKLVQNRLGGTLHARDLAGKQYPYTELFKLLRGVHYNGWILIEASDMPTDRVAALARERQAFENLTGADKTAAASKNG
jgi:sugar phosphate isomerase/epimerase